MLATDRVCSRFSACFVDADDDDDDDGDEWYDDSQCRNDKYLSTASIDYNHAVIPTDPQKDKSTQRQI